MRTTGKMWICWHVLGALGLATTFYYLTLPEDKKKELKDKIMKLEKCKCEAIKDSK